MVRKMTLGKKAAAFILALSVSVISLTENVQAAVGMESSVTMEMCSATYWNSLMGDYSDVTLMTAEQISHYNEAALLTPDCHMHDLTAMDDVYDAAALRDSLAAGVVSEMPNKAVYVNSTLMDTGAYYGFLAESIRMSGWEGSMKPFYALGVSQTQIRSVPTLDYIGYSETDTDDEAVLSSLRVNEPFVIKQCASVNGHVFYFGYSDNVSGWVDSMDVAICASKAEWLDLWQTSLTDRDFLVVYTDYFHLSQSHYAPAVSDLMLTMGTTLKLVPDSELPKNIAGRGTWNNYAVYVPTRDANGYCVKQIALIAQNKEVAVGYLPMTSRNIVNIAFEYLGDTYGWGGMLDSVDCSALVRNVYKCFGLDMPRNTNWQKEVAGTAMSLEGMDDITKTAAIAGCFPGMPLYMSGHTMIYLGTVNGVNYVISALGSVSDSCGEVEVQQQNSVAITPLTVRRRNGSTWLSNINSGVMPWTVQ